MNFYFSYEQRQHKTSTPAARLQQQMYSGSASPAVSAIVSESSSRTITLESGIEAILSTDGEEESVASHEDGHVGQLIRDSAVEFRCVFNLQFQPVLLS